MRRFAVGIQPAAGAAAGAAAAAPAAWVPRDGAVMGSALTVEGSRTEPSSKRRKSDRPSLTKLVYSIDAATFDIVLTGDVGASMSFFANSLSAS